MTRADLIAALEKAEGPDRELDCEILQAIGLPKMFFGSEVVKWWRDGDNWRCETANGYLHVDALFTPRYTASLDAALTLVPDGWVFTLSTDDNASFPNAAAHAECADVPWASAYVNRVSDAHAATPAIALCIAALKAALPIDTERPLTDEDRAAIANDPFAALKARE